MRYRIPPLLQTSDLAAIFDVEPPTVRRWWKAGLIPGFRIGRELRFRQSDIANLIGQPCIDTGANSEVAADCFEQEPDR
jgi:hypothetical protein